MERTPHPQPIRSKSYAHRPRATATLGRTLGWDNFTAYASNNGDYFGPNTYGTPDTPVLPSS